MKTIFTNLIIIGSFLMFYASCNTKTQADEKNERIRVKTITSQRREFALPIRTSGKLASKNEFKLSFKTGGIISRIYTDEGQNVRKGQVLARLNLLEIQAQVSQAKLAYEKAGRDMQRAENLYNDSVATLEQFQNTKTAYEVAKANLEIASFNLQHSTIKAPANGKILKRLAEQNELIAPGHPLFIMASTDKEWIVRVNITDKDIVKITTGDSAFVYFDAYRNEVFPATVSETGNFADPYTGTFEVELKIKNNKKPLVSGFIAKAEIIPAQKLTIYPVPVDVLIEASGFEAFIYEVKNNKPIKTKVGILTLNDNEALIKSGIDSTTLIISDGIHYLSSGKEIEIVD